MVIVKRERNCIRGLPTFLVCRTFVNKETDFSTCLRLPTHCWTVVALIHVDVLATVTRKSWADEAVIVPLAINAPGPWDCSKNRHTESDHVQSPFVRAHSASDDLREQCWCRTVGKLKGQKILANDSCGYELCSLCLLLELWWSQKYNGRIGSKSSWPHFKMSTQS